ncbi:MAG: serine/threonine protein kinase, partial [Balneolaceae bacterium]
MDHTNQPDEKNYWEKLGILYDQASLLVGDERTTFLKTNCKDDSLRAELESLLQVHDASARYFESLSDSLLGQAIDRMSDMPPDEEIIGKYRITGKIGRGGMGTVYLGERADETFDKKVAIKVLRRGLDSEDILSRFRAERQILARLNHPNITHMIDGGITSQGRPWFVMEYVDGVPITQYCDDNKLNLEKRLELFTVVCDAVQYAHQNLVIHRDLKPSNILVTPDGHIKLLDFGIAKVLDDPDSTDPHTRFTRAGFRPLTPAFASPEQFSGEPVSTASDVYSLGVLLYLLLTGRLPYQQKPDSFPDSDVFKNRQDPPLPSKAITAPNTDPSGRSSLPARLDSARLEKQLSGDLDTILLTALRIDPSRRYTTAKALADDIRNHLTGHPVVARPDGWQYRAGKFIGRHKTGVAVAVLLPLMIITGLYLHGEQLEKERDLARTAAERAELEAAKAQEVSVFLTGLFRSADPFETAEELTSIELLERGREQLSELDEHTEVSAEMSAVL